MQPVRPVRWSELRWMAESPAHYRAAITHHREPTAAMQLGTVVHAMVLGGDFVVWDGERRAGKEWDRFASEHAGRTIIKRSEMERASAIADSIRTNRAAQEILYGAKYEVPAEWSYMGRACATGGIDVISLDTLAELKTCATANPVRFAYHARSMGYLGQLAWYEEAARSLGFTPKRLAIIAAETKPPYAVTVMALTPNAVDYGRKTVRSLMEQLRVCEESDRWPAYCESEVPLDIEQDAELIFGDEEAA